MANVLRKTAALGALGLVLSGCAEGPVFEAPAFPFLQSYSQAQDPAPVLLSNSAWWRGLDDPTLDRMIALGLRDNLGLAAARERVVQAQANRNTISGGITASPSAQITATGDENTGPDITGMSRLGLSWVLDPYGARQSQVDGAEARIDRADAERDAAQLLVVFNIATAYADLRYQQRALALSRSELGNRNATLALTRTLQEADQGTRLESTRSRARVAEIRARLPALEAAVTAKLNELAVLTGTQPGGLPADLSSQLAHGSGQLVPQMSPQVGIPADLLRNRPDIAIAEANYYAAVADVGVAHANLYPRLSLTGAITLNGLAGSGNGAEYFFGPVLQLPDLPLGTARAAVEARHSAAREAHIAWKSTVLSAILEVETSLGDYNATITAMRSAQSAAHLYAEARTLTRQVVRSGEATLSDLILAEQALATSEQTLASMQRNAAAQFIALNIRLGAGNAVDTMDLRQTAGQ